MTAIDRLFPRWASSWAALARSNAHVRSQCRLCGLQQRVDSGAQALRFGGGASPVDQLDMCSVVGCHGRVYRSEEHTSELQSLMRISSAVFCLKKKHQNSRYTIE